LPGAAWGSITREQKTELMQSVLHHRENQSSLLPPCFSKEDGKCNNDDTPQDRIVLGYGPRRVLILVVVHGNEYCGVHAVREILGRFCLFHGTNRITKSDLQDDSYWDDEPLSALFDLLTIEFVVGNPQACQNSVRFLKKNLNRMFDKPILLDEDQRSNMNCNEPGWLWNPFDKPILSWTFTRVLQMLGHLPCLYHYSK
jgi:hypothetical protein